ncbi:MAG: F0F1 ATP synthase subunit A, partial [Acidobacteriota bacterium]|nr:F0F1 ATP synthase subunit A [Acidobacteriota bacterium]
MEHEHSILYGPFNKLAHPLLGFDVPDHVIMALLVLLICAIVFPLTSRKISKDNPSNFQQFLELIVGGLKGLLNDIVGPHSERFLYIIGGFAVFIFISNLMGLFFFLQPPTGNINTTFALSLTAFLYYNYQGIRAQGAGHYLAHFAGPI